MLLIGQERGKGQIGKIPGPSPSKSGKSQKKSGKDEKGRKKEGQVQIGKPPRLAALDYYVAFHSFFRGFHGPHLAFLPFVYFLGEKARKNTPKTRFQNVGKGGVSLRGVAFLTVLAVLVVLESTLPPFACPTKYSAKRRPWRF